MNVNDKWVEEYATHDRWSPVIRELAQDLREARAALSWAVGEGAMACKGEVSGRYSFVAVAEPGCDCDDVEPPAELLPVLMEAAQRAFLTTRTSKGVAE